MIIQLAFFFASFALIWFGAGFLIDTITVLAQRIKIPPFTLSFFVLGILTSLPETTIGAFSAAADTPEMFVGNFLGGSIVLLLFVIPLLAILGNGVKNPRHVSRRSLLLILSVIVAPSLFVADQNITPTEAVIFLFLYLILFGYFAFEQSMFEKLVANVRSRQKLPANLVLNLIGGALMLCFGGYQIVQSTNYFASALSISPFFVSLIAVSFGTNIPEIALIVRSIKKNKKDVALADYLGSAAANVPLLGFFTLVSGGTIHIPNHVVQRVVFTVLGILLFFRFSATQKTISRFEGFALLGLYMVFVVVETYVALFLT